jgi:hypothetical protein
MRQRLLQKEVTMQVIQLQRGLGAEAKKESLASILVTAIGIPLGVVAFVWYLDKTSPARRPIRRRARAR